MRLFDKTLVVIINNSIVTVDATNPVELKRIDTKLDVLDRRRYPLDRRKEFAIPLLPVEGIDMEDRIKLSIDWRYRRYDMHENSIVDIHDGKFAFFFVDRDDIEWFDVTRWDKEEIYCSFSSSRPFTILETMTTQNYNYNYFVRNGKIYSSKNDTLMVFDIRSSDRIRKLGHFVRMDYAIEDIAVLENDDILLLIRWTQNFAKSPNSQSKKRHLFLLENPE
jgi:hypothetical protein